MSKRKTVMIMFKHRKRSPEASYLYRYLEQRDDLPFDVIAVEDSQPLATVFDEWGCIPDVLFIGFGMPESVLESQQLLKDNNIKVIMELGDVEDIMSVIDKWATFVDVFVFGTAPGWENYGILTPVLEKYRVEYEHLPWSVDIDAHENDWDEKDIPVSMVCTMNPEWRFHKTRTEILKRILDIPGSESFVTGQFYGAEYMRLLKRSRIFVVDATMRNVWVSKYTEGGASGCLMIGDKPHDPDNILEDGISFVEADKDNIVEKITYYTEHTSDAKRIAKECQRRIREHFSRERVTERFVEIVMTQLDGKEGA